MRNSVRSLLLAPFICCTLLAQSKGGGAASGATSGSGNAATLPSSTNPGGGTNAPGIAPPVGQPLYISGRVITDDGLVPNQSVTIIRDCNGVTRTMGYTDAKGHFSFDLNHADAGFQDARTPGLGVTSGDPNNTRAALDDPFSGIPQNGNLSGQRSYTAALMGCELRAQLSGYRSAAIQLGQRNPLDNPDIGVILLHRGGPDEGTTVSMTSLKVPKNAKKAFDNGLDAMKKKKTGDAENDFQKAVAIYPQYADAWFHLGAIQMDANNNEAARKSFAQAMAADPKLVTPYVNLAILDAREGKWKETADGTATALHLDPIDFPVAFYFNALANYNLHNFDQAEKSARQLETIDPQHRFPMTNRILAAVLTEKKDYPGAAQQMREYLKVAGTAEDAGKVREQLQQLEKIIDQQPSAASSQRPTGTSR